QPLLRAWPLWNLPGACRRRHGKSVAARSGGDGNARPVAPLRRRCPAGLPGDPGWAAGQYPAAGACGGRGRGGARGPWACGSRRAGDLVSKLRSAPRCARGAVVAMAVILAVLHVRGAATAAATAPIAMQSRVPLLAEEANGRAVASWHQLQAAPEELARCSGPSSAAGESG